VEVSNVNPAGFIPLSAYDLERVMLPGYKAHTCSAVSDGLGLDSVSKAVKAAQGCARLSQDAIHTTAHISLPATVRTSSQGEDTPIAHLLTSGQPSGKQRPQRTSRRTSPGSDTSWEDDCIPLFMPIKPTAPRRSHQLRRVNSAPDSAYPRASAGWQSSSPQCIGLFNANHTQTVFDSTLPTDYLRSTHIHAEADLAKAQGAPLDAGQVVAVAQAPNLSGLSRTGSAWNSQTKSQLISPRSGGQPTTPLAPNGPTAAAQARAQPTEAPAADEAGEKEGEAGEAALEDEPVAVEEESRGAAGKRVIQEGASPEEAPRTLRVCTLDDESIPRMIQKLFIKHHLHASLAESCTLGANEEEMHAFVDVALGKLNADLTPNLSTHRQADIVLLDENIQPPQIMGSLMSGELRDRGYAGVIAILTGASASGTEEIRALPAVDLVFEKGHSLPNMAKEIFRVLGIRRPAEAIQFC
jgi:hypothetical protein